MVIQLHLPSGLSVPEDNFVPVHWFSRVVIVPPGNQVLCLAWMDDIEYEEKLFGYYVSRIVLYVCCTCLCLKSEFIS